MSYVAELLDQLDISNLQESEKKPPSFVTGKCKRCGNCCIGPGCPAYDHKTQKCLIYHCRPVACRIYPGHQQAIDLFDCPGFKSSH